MFLPGLADNRYGEVCHAGRVIARRCIHACPAAPGEWSLLLESCDREIDDLRGLAPSCALRQPALISARLDLCGGLSDNWNPYRDQSTLSRAGGPSRKTGNELLIYEDFNGGRGCILG
jgi:hypothetical protein